LTRGEDKKRRIPTKEKERKREREIERKKEKGGKTMEDSRKHDFKLTTQMRPSLHPNFET